jgi:hypothetical protein
MLPTDRPSLTTFLATALRSSEKYAVRLPCDEMRRARDPK